MKTAFHLVLVAAVAAVLHGCGDDQSSKTLTIDTPEGKKDVKVDVSADKDTVQFKTEDGDVKVKGGGGKIEIEDARGKASMETDASGVTKFKSTDKDGKETTSEFSGKTDVAAFEGMLYPGATAEEGASFSSKAAGMSTSSASFWSDDAPEKLAEHYKKTFPKATSMTMGTVTSITGKKADGSDFSISVAPGEGNGKTRLTLMVIKKD
jgi:hypothetical protein